MDEVCAKVCRGCMPWAPWFMNGVYTCQSVKAADFGHLFSDVHPVCKDMVRREENAVNEKLEAVRREMMP